MGRKRQEGPQEWAQGESAASACDRVGDCLAVATLLQALRGGPAPPPPPRWPCAPFPAAVALRPLPLRGGPAALFPSTLPRLDQALPGSRGGPHGPPPQIILKQSITLHFLQIEMDWYFSVNIRRFIDYLQSPIHSPIAHVNISMVDNHLVKWQCSSYKVV